MIVREIELFKGIDIEVMNEIADICVEETYLKDTILFEKDAEAERLYILVEGTVKLIIKNGGTLTYSLTEQGNVFGWSCMVETGRYTAAGICATDVKAIKIEKEQLDKIFFNHPLVGLKVLRRLAGVFSNRLTSAYRDLLSARGAGVDSSYG